MSHEWKYKIQSPQTGKMELGPFSEHEFVQLIDNGTIKSNTMVQCPERKKGRWVAAGRVPALARLMEKREPLPPTFDTQQDQGSLSERLPMAHEWKYKGLAGPEFGPIAEQFLVELINDGRVPDTAMVKSATRTNGQWFEARNAPVINVMIKSPAELAEIKKRPVPASKPLSVQASKPLSNEPLDGRALVAIALLVAIVGGLLAGIVSAAGSPLGLVLLYIVIVVSGVFYVAGVIRWGVSGSQLRQLTHLERQNDEIIKLLKTIAENESS